MDDRIKQFIKKYRIKQRKTGELILYKAVTGDFGSLHLYIKRGTNYGVGAYKPRTEVSCKRYSTNINNLCGSGLHVGTLKCAKTFAEYRDFPVIIVKVIVDPKDIVCVPKWALKHDQDFCDHEMEKIRVKRLIVEKVIKKVNRYIWATV